MNQKDRGAEVTRSGVQIGSASLGAFLGSAIGPEGGAAVGEAAAQLGEGLFRWREGRRASRASMILEQVHAGVQRRTADGEAVRAEVGDLSSNQAMAVFETVVEAAEESNDERKCIVIANLYESIMFDSFVSTDDALLYLKRI